MSNLIWIYNCQCSDLFVVLYNNMRKIFGLLLFFSVSSIQATTYYLPKHIEDSLLLDSLPEPHYTLAKQEDTLLDIARDFDIGQNEILLANPHVDRWLPGAETRVRIPNSHLLPDTPRQGLVLNLAEFRLYFFSKSDLNEPAVVKTHPISIGRVDWDTPLGKTRIIAKTKNPVWRPPKSIKAEHAAEGDILPDVVPAGPDNPLGDYALRLGIPGYLIHSTNKPYGVGMRVSHGCIRMYPEDIEVLYQLIETGSPVYIVNQSVKVGWHQGKLYVQIFPELEGNEMSYEQRLELTLNLIEKKNAGRLPVLDGAKLKTALQQRNGIPVVVFERKFVYSVEMNE